MRPRTRNAHTNTPTTIEGSPAMSSAVKRTTAAHRPLRYSTTKIAAAIPIGTAIAPATTPRRIVPTIAGETPPPTTPNGRGRSVKNDRSSAGTPRTATYPTMSTSRRATALTTIATSRSPSAISTIALKYRSLSASVNWFAIADAIVYPGVNSEGEIVVELLPTTRVTAIVSPKARATPRAIPPTMPARAYGSTARVTVSQRVAPRPTMASRWLSGTASSTSRETARRIGRIMIARITPPISRSSPTIGPDTSAPTSGTSPRARCSAGSMTDRMSGTTTKNPQRPYTMLGTYARTSMSSASGARTPRGEYSVRKIAAPIAIGAARTTATAVVTIVPYTYAPAPKTSFTGSHVVVVRNDRPYARMDGSASRTRRTMMRASVAGTSSASPATLAVKIRSDRRVTIQAGP